MALADGQHATVVALVRPAADSERGRDPAVRVVGEDTVLAHDGSSFAFDAAFGPENTPTSTDRDPVAPRLLEHCLRGGASVVFSMGTRGAGKTHALDALLGRFAGALFGALDRERLAGAASVAVRATAVELHCEAAYDRLGPRPKLRLPVREHPRTGPYVQGARRVPVPDTETAARLARRARDAAQRAGTADQGHLVYTLAVSVTRVDADGAGASETTGRVVFVDVAATGRAVASARRRSEASAVNRSLSTLARVVAALNAGGHVPYRDSTLTRLLRPALGGRAATFVLAALSPAAAERRDTLATLRFAGAMRRVVSAGISDGGVALAAVVVPELEADIQALVSTLSLSDQPPSVIEWMRGELAELERRLAESRGILEGLRSSPGSGLGLGSGLGMGSGSSAGLESAGLESAGLESAVVESAGPGSESAGPGSGTEAQAGATATHEEMDTQGLAQPEAQTDEEAADPTATTAAGATHAARRLPPLPRTPERGARPEPTRGAQPRRPQLAPVRRRASAPCLGATPAHDAPELDAPALELDAPAHDALDAPAEAWAPESEDPDNDFADLFADDPDFSRWRREPQAFARPGAKEAAFLRAAAASRVDVMEELLDAGVDVNCRNSFGRSAAQIAARNGSLPTLYWVADHGGDLHATGEKGDSALALAAWNGHLAVARYLEEEGVDVHATDINGQNAAHVAARRGELRVLRWLHRRGVDCHLADAAGRTPLLEARFGGNGCHEFLRNGEGRRRSLAPVGAPKHNPYTMVSSPFWV